MRRGFGTAPLVIDAGMTPEHFLQDYFSKLSTEDLQTIRAILRKYSTPVAEIVESGESRVGLSAAR